MQAITGTVLHGNGLGQTIGFPTANIFCDNLELSAGTRRYNILYQDKIYQAIGPYFPDRKLMEAHLLDFDGDLYDQELLIYPLQLIRINQKFDDFYDLTKQILQDRGWVLDHPITVMTFGTFDHFHAGHASYLSQAKHRGDKLVTIVARDTTVNTLKNKQADNDELMRKQQVQKSKIADVVVLGDERNPYQCMLDYQPQIICLGYDQHSFEEGIIHFYQEQNRTPPQLVRLDAFEPQKYKSSLYQC